jgi:hypothetical protein
LGSTIVVAQSASADETAQLPEGIAPAGGDLRFRARLHVVGITKSTSEEVNWMPSSAFYDRYRAKLAGVVNGVLGAGKRLFGDTSDKKRLRLADSKTVGHDGVTILTYVPASD